MITLRRPKTEGHADRGTSWILSWLSLVLLIIGFLFVFAYSQATDGNHTRYLAVGILTAIAALVSGCLLGFLFGIPKVVSSGEARLRGDSSTGIVKTETPDTTVTTAVVPTPEAATDVRDRNSKISPFEPSTNLSEVSDWLTKLLLGAGLVQLTHLGKPSGRLVQAIGAGLSNTQPDRAAQVVGAALVVAYSVLGFLDGYVVTTLWYGGKVRKTL